MLELGPKLLAALVSVALPLAGAWSSASAAEDPTVAPDAIVAPPHDESHAVGLGRVRVGHPLGLSAGVGVLFARQPANYDCRSICDYRGLVLQAEPGVRGAQLSAGYAVVTGEKRREGFFLPHVYVGYGIRGALLRSWSNSPLEPSRQTLAGVEGAFTVAQFSFTLGLFHQIAGESATDPWLLAGGFGWGF
jgi:hypothetical protein